MRTIGSGNCGSKLAVLFDEEAVLLSTADQDAANFRGQRVHKFNNDGCGKKFGTGLKLWNTRYSQLEYALEDITNDQVIVFSSLGGGSGSSSLQFISKILIEQGNKVLIIGVLPFKKEVVPPLANAVQALNSLLPFINDVSIMLFDNQILLKEYDNNWQKVNDSIIQKINYTVNLISKHSSDGYSPATIDQSELESVIFGGGFIDLSDNFLEEKPPKFAYGRLDKETKNVLIAMFVDEEIKSKELLEEYHNILTTVQSKYAGRARNARIVPGIIRGRIKDSNSERDIEDRAYITIASGLNVDKYSTKIEKLRDEAVEKATIFSTRQKGRKLVSNKDSKVLDI